MPLQRATTAPVPAGVAATFMVKGKTVVETQTSANGQVKTTTTGYNALATKPDLGKIQNAGDRVAVTEKYEKASDASGKPALYSRNVTVSTFDQRGNSTGLLQTGSFAYLSKAAKDTTGLGQVFKGTAKVVAADGGFDPWFDASVEVSYTGQGDMAKMTGVKIMKAG